ncbi:hypothetical protein [Cellvibrio mixtus]|uniref:hypothetical protein n=1 Tax=Cellvibrio mixtus TaxID=39650 RepID=UPI00058789D9|nr:hypothetical protein [Cellvibrio mixtus]
MTRVPARFVLLPLCALIPLSGIAAENDVSVTLGANHYWDSNFARLHEKPDSEHYSQFDATLSVNHSYKSQQWNLRARASQLEYDVREEMDESYYAGSGFWKSDWADSLRTGILWQRQAYAVDRLEFVEQDIVSRDDWNAYVDIGRLDSLSLLLGGRHSSKKHSNPKRKSMEFDEDEASAQISYHFPGQSRINIRGAYGEREYLSPRFLSVAPDATADAEIESGNVAALAYAPNQFDFDFIRAEVNTEWVLSPKSRIDFQWAYFERDGLINEDDGDEISIEYNWDITRKIKTLWGARKAQPAQGEMNDSPDQIVSLYAQLSWALMRNLTWSFSANKSEYDYLPGNAFAAPTEKVVSITPVQLRYAFAKQLTLEFAATYVDRESLVLIRDFDYTRAHLGLQWDF